MKSLHIIIQFRDIIKKNSYNKYNLYFHLIGFFQKEES